MNVLLVAAATDVGMPARSIFGAVPQFHQKESLPVLTAAARVARFEPNWLVATPHRMGEPAPEAFTADEESRVARMSAAIVSLRRSAEAPRERRVGTRRSRAGCVNSAESLDTQRLWFGCALWAAGGALKKELHSDNRSQAKMPMPSGRPTMALSPGYRPPTRGTTAAAPPAAPPTAPPAFSLAGAASVAAGIIASGCINVRQKLAAVADEEVKLLASSTSALREAAAKREDEQLSRLSNTLDVLRTSAAKERSFPSLKMALMLDFDTQTPVPTGSPMPRLQGGAEGVSERWRPTESARERVAARVQERLDAAYDAAEAELRHRLQHLPLELEAVAAQPMPWGVSPEPHFYDVAQGCRSSRQPDVAHPGAWGVSPAPLHPRSLRRPRRGAQPCPAAAWGVAGG